MEKEWYYRTRQREHGPISSKELHRLIENGLVLPTTLVRRGPAGKWSHVSDLEGSLNQSAASAQPIRATSTNGANLSTTQPSAQQPLEVASESESSWPILWIVGGSITGLAILTVVLVMKASAPSAEETSVKPVAASSNTESMTTEEVVSRSEGSVAFIKGRLSSGTGFLAEPKFLVTNKHVVSEELIGDLKVHFPSAPEGHRGPFSVRLLYEDESLDLAFLHIETTLPPLPLAPTYQFRRGQEVIVIGNPGVKDDLVLQNAVSKGVMSTEATIKDHSYYQLGISINSGNSGGPVFDSRGQVIGVVTLKASRKEGLGFCIPLLQLQQTIEKSKQVPARDLEVAESLHRVRAVFTLTAIMGDEYKTGMGYLRKVMEDSLDRGRSVNEGMDAIQAKVHEKLAAYDQTLLSELKSEVSKISRDQNLPESVRQKFIDLWTNYTELKSYVEKPRGTYDTYKAKYLDLSDNHDRLTESLKLLLGIETPE